MYSTGATRSQRYYYAHPLNGRLLPRQAYDSAMLITQQMDGQGRQRRPTREADNGREERVRPRTAGEMGRRSDNTSVSVFEEKEEAMYRTSRHSGANNHSARPHTAQPSFSAASFTASPSLSSRTTAPSSTRSPLPASYDTTTTSDYDSDDSITTATTTTNPYDQLYSTLVSLLLAHRIVSEDGIERLLVRAAEVNGHLNRKKVEWVCDAVRQEMRLKVETEDRQRRDEDSRQAWQEDENGEDDSRLESEEEEAEDEQQEEEKEDDQPVTEAEWEAMAAEPFYQRPTHSDDEDDNLKPQLPATPQRMEAKDKMEEVKQQEEEEQVERPFQQSDSEDESQQGESAESEAESEADEQPAKEEVLPPTDDEWYEDDETSDDQPQPSPVVDNNSAGFDKEIIRAESGTHTIEEGEEEEEEEGESDEAAAITANDTQQFTLEADVDDEYGDEQYESEF